MKASIKFREEKSPLMRAKVPISVLGFPLTSGFAVGDASEMRLDLATAFDSGPSFRFSYRPTDPWRPFSIVLKTGVGPLGSLFAAAPVAMTAEFTPLARGGAGPSFSVLFKPRFGDFSITKSVRSSSSPAAHWTTTNGEGVTNNGFEAPLIFGFRPFENGTNSNSGEKANGEFWAGDRIGGVGGIGRLFSVPQVMARSVLPLWSQTALKLRWGLRVPPELRTVLTDDGRRASMTGASLSKLPLLLLNKISIERSTDKGKEKKNKNAYEAYTASTEAVKCQLGVLRAEHGSLWQSLEKVHESLDEVKCQLGVLQAEHGSLWQSLEKLHEEFIDWKTAPVVAGRASGIADLGRCGVSPPLPAGSGNWDRQGNREVPGEFR